MGTANIITLAGAGAFSGSSFLPTTRAYQAAIVANSGTIADATLTAHDTLYTGMVSAELTTGLEFLWTQCGLDFAASQVAYIHPNPDRLVSVTGFVAGDWSEITGYNPGTNTTKYVDSNWIPKLDEMSFGWYSHTNQGFSNHYFGYNDAAAGTRFEIWPKYSSDSKFYGNNGNKSPNYELLSSGAVDASGFWLCSWGDTSGFASRNGVTVVSNPEYTAQFSGDGTISAGLWAYKNKAINGTISWARYLSMRKSLFVAWNRALSESEAAAMSTLVDAFYTAIGRVDTIENQLLMMMQN